MGRWLNQDTLAGALFVLGGAGGLYAGRSVNVGTADAMGEGYVPLAPRMKADGIRLDVAAANAAVMRWLDEVANARGHATTGAIPAIRLAEERLVMLPPPRPVSRPAIRPAIAVRRVVAFESLQYPLSDYDELLEVAA